MSRHHKTNRQTSRARRFEALEKREMFFIDDIWDTAKDLASDGADAVKDAADWVIGAAETATEMFTDSWARMSDFDNWDMAELSGLNDVERTGGDHSSWIDTVKSSTGKQLRALHVQGTSGKDFVSLSQDGDKITVRIRYDLYEEHKKVYSAKDFDIVLVKLGDGHDEFSNTTNRTVWAWGGKGNDKFYAGFSGSVRYMGEAGNDQLNVTDPREPNRTSFPLIGKVINLEGYPVYQQRVVLDGGADADRIFGTDFDDRLIGGDGHDLIYGRAGDDVIYGGEGNDIIYGGSDNDVIYGGDGHDRLYGQEGLDRLYGELGEDLLDGGDDLVRDVLDGGAEADLFLTRKGGMTDADILAELKDFRQSDGDRLDYNDMFFKFIDVNLIRSGIAGLGGITVTGKGNKKSLVPSSSFGMSNQTTPTNPLPVLVDMSVPQTPAPVVIDFGSLVPPTEPVVDLNRANDIYIPLTTPVISSMTTNIGAATTINMVPVTTNKSFLVKRSRL